MLLCRHGCQGRWVSGINFRKWCGLIGTSPVVHSIVVWNIEKPSILPCSGFTAIDLWSRGVHQDSTISPPMSRPALLYCGGNQIGAVPLVAGDTASDFEWDSARMIDGKATAGICAAWTVGTAVCTNLVRHGIAEMQRTTLARDIGDINRHVVGCVGRFIETVGSDGWFVVVGDMIQKWTRVIVGPVHR